MRSRISEYQDLAAAVQEASFLRSLSCEMGNEQSQPTNQSCIKLATNPVTHKRSKHIDTKFHFIREKVDDNSIQTGSRSVDKGTSTSESRATSKATIGLNTDSSYDIRNNLSRGVEEKNLVKFLELYY